ncbi:MAG: HPr family phosphocarrier protein [Atopobiaceae bacterium]|nr:HPr family phosphocarrier protein [Atopobiaceae bacterium]
MMHRLSFDVKDPQGLHAQSVARLANVLSAFDCSAKLYAKGSSCDARSIFEVLALAIPAGSRATLVLEGDDASACADALADVLATL